MIKCDYCGHEENGNTPFKPGDKCYKCKQGIFCLKGSKGNPK